MRLFAACVGANLVVALGCPAPALGQGAIVSGIVHVRETPPRGAVVYLIPEEATPLVPDAEPVLLDQRDLQFIPHTLVVVPGQAVAFRNSDPLLHNVFSPHSVGEEFNLGTYPSGESRIQVFQRPGPHVILCHIHPEMEAYIFVAPTRYHAVVDEEGRFRIEDLPPGDYTLHAWHPRAAPYQRTTRLRDKNVLDLEIQLERRRARANRGN